MKLKTNHAPPPLVNDRRQIQKVKPEEQNRDDQ